MNLKQLIEDYNRKVPRVLKDNEHLKSLLLSAKSDEVKAMLLLLGDNKWYVGCHQWYLRLHKDIYDGAIADIISHRLWEIPLDAFNSFEELYDNIAQWLRRPYINQLTIYDVALRLVIAREERPLCLVTMSTFMQSQERSIGICIKRNWFHTNQKVGTLECPPMSFANTLAH